MGNVLNLDIKMKKCLFIFKPSPPFMQGLICCASDLFFMIPFFQEICFVFLRLFFTSCFMIKRKHFVLFNNKI